jgi:hypothetical protein
MISISEILRIFDKVGTQRAYIVSRMSFNFIENFKINNNLEHYV